MRTWTWAALLVLLAVLGFCVYRGLPPFARRKPALPPAPRPQPPATITAVGDILLGARVGRLAAATGVEHVFAGVAPLLRSDDFTIANLECAVTTGGVPADKRYTFRANPKLLPGLRRSGIEAVSLANNHSLDYGRSALRETIAGLHAAGIATAGAGQDLDAAMRPALLRARGQTIALVATSRVLPAGSWYAGPRHPGIASAYEPTRLLQEIRSARAAADAVIVYLHWGAERARRPQSYQRALAHQCIDAGADAVVGAHPHVLQGFEYYRGRLIAYSLGNFVFTGGEQTTAALRMTFRSGKPQKATVIPCLILNCRPQVIRNAAQRARVLRALQARSFGVRISDDGDLSP